MRRSFHIAAVSICAALLCQSISAQTLQLPTFSFATVTTTVLVPDQGSALLGGINRASDGRNEFGIPGLTFPGLQNRSIGRNVSGSNMSVTATIHDLDEMDQALLGSPSDLASIYPRGSHSISDVPMPWAPPGPRLDPVNLAGNWRQEAAPALPVSKVAVEVADRESQRATRSSEAEDYFARGQQAEADGKPSVAKIFYQMAARRASGALKQQVIARLERRQRQDDRAGNEHTVTH